MTSDATQILYIFIKGWLGYRDLNSEPAGYEPDALTIELYPNVGSDDRT